MVNNKGIPIGIKKPVETVYELKNETQSVVGDQIPSFEEFMKTYENDGSLNYDDLNSSDIGMPKVCGPMYRTSSDNYTRFSVKYKFNHSEGNRKNYFEQSGSYSNNWNISGSIWDLKDEQWKLEDGKIKVVRINNYGVYERNKAKEEEVKDQLRKDIRKFELWRCGNPGNIEREFNDKIILVARMITLETQTVYACPQLEWEKKSGHD